MKTYTKNGLRFIEVDIEDFQIKYWDKPKKSATYTNYINGGFFGNYSERLIMGKKTFYTLPVMNLMCDIDVKNTNPTAVRYLDEWTHGNAFKMSNKLKINCNEHASSDYRNKEISTLIITKDDKAYIEPMNSMPSNAKYGISGIITLEDGADVDWEKYVVKKQGVGEGTVYGTYRNWVALGHGGITIISGRTYTYNYIYKSEIYKKIADMGFTQILALDGGGSMHLRQNGKNIMSTWENRQVNNIIVF